ncbi:hypothetical protein NDU88_000014 [Pleurodeles waltl]|uniref:Uncharacterized protein n=1 Tax=Pleurodeles waltl TaxID=8319 RepID=A0AAV7SVP5_PLEWA|nr:hypothetical protein NDU88_000014 [Pleurodeles waltl]
MQLLCTGLQEQVTGGAYRESVMQALGAGLQEQGTDCAGIERVMQVLCTGLQEQGTRGVYGETDASAVHGAAGAAYWRCMQRQ